jgi:hypothetical protein
MRRCANDVERATFASHSVDQTARAAPVFGIGLQNFRLSDCLQDVIQADVLFNHLLLRVLRDPELSACRLQLDADE